jgi:WD40 repeat protein
MNVPSRETLLDIEWLIHTHTAEGYEALLRVVRAGAEAYGGLVTAVAEAVLRLRWPSGDPRLLDAADIRHGLAHALATGSWSTDPDGPRSARGCIEWLLPGFPAEKREEIMAKNPRCEPPALPDLHRLHLVEPLDCAWVGHYDGIWGCQVSADGRCMVSASRDGDVAVWDMESGTLIARGRSGEREIRDCALTRDGNRVISVHRSGRISIWDLQTMVTLAAFVAPSMESQRPASSSSLGVRGSLNRRRRIGFSPDGRRLAVAGADSVDIWDLDLVARVATLQFEPALPSGVLAVFFSSNATVVTVGDSDPLPVLTWDLAAETVVAHAMLNIPPSKYVSRATLTPDRCFLVAAGHVETTVWRLDSPTPVAVAPYDTTGQALAVSADGTLAATSGYEDDARASGATLRVWSLPDLQKLWSWNLRDLGCRDIACALAFAPDGRHLVVAGWEGVLRRVVLPRR